MNSLRCALEEKGFHCSEEAGKTGTAETVAAQATSQKKPKRAKPNDKVVKAKKPAPKVRKAKTVPTAEASVPVVPAAPAEQIPTLVERRELGIIGVIDVELPKSARLMPYQDGRHGSYIQVKLPVDGGGYVCMYLHNRRPDLFGTRVCARAVVMLKKLSDGAEYLYVDLHLRPGPATHKVELVPIGTLVLSNDVWRRALPLPLNRMMLIGGPLGMRIKLPATKTQ
jgi:hypothetical protein